MAPPPKIPGEENEQQENILNEDDDLPGGNLNINELLNSVGPIMPQQEAGRKRKAAVFQPLEGDLLGLLWICVYAVDEDGRSFKGEDTIAGELSKKGRRLFLIGKDGEAPLAVENRNGKLFICSGHGTEYRTGRDSNRW